MANAGCYVHVLPLTIFQRSKGSRRRSTTTATTTTTTTTTRPPALSGSRARKLGKSSSQNTPSTNLSIPWLCDLHRLAFAATRMNRVHDPCRPDSAVVATTPAAERRPESIVIIGARVIDGNGGPSYLATIEVRKQHIHAIHRVGVHPE